MKNYIIFDAHCDTADKILTSKNHISQKNLHVNKQAIKSYKRYAQFFAAFVSDECCNNPLLQTLELINTIYDISKQSDMLICTDVDDLKRAWFKNKAAAFISIENAKAIKSIQTLEILYSLGVRMMSLTHNCNNHLGSGAYGEGGLSEFGKEIVLKMNELGMIVDLSHLNEETFYDITSIATFPVVLSHSNSYTICPHKRNIKDEQFNEIKRLNGVCGICYYPPFLTQNKSCTIDDIVMHIEYFLSLDGENNICLGSDFDGIDSMTDNISGAMDVYKILNALSKKGISDNIIEKIAYKNIMRVIGICL